MKGGDAERAQAGPDQAINVGLIGCGLIGQAHAAGVLKSPGARLIAVADRDRARMEAYAIRYGAPAGYTEVGELLARSDLDNMIIRSRRQRRGLPKALTCSRHRRGARGHANPVPGQQAGRENPPPSPQTRQLS